MNKAQLIDSLSTRLGSKKAANDAVEGVIDTVTRAVAAGERVAITGFGVFEKVARPARTGRNPRTGASVKIKATTVPKFKAGQSFKDVVSGAKKLPKVAASSAKKSSGSGSTTKSSASKGSAAKKSSASSKSSAARTLATKTPAKSAAAKKSAAKTLGSGSAKKSAGRRS